jgi:hypothetical protein
MGSRIPVEASQDLNKYKYLQKCFENHVEGFVVWWPFLVQISVDAYA